MVVGDRVEGGVVSRIWGGDIGLCNFEAVMGTTLGACAGGQGGTTLGEGMGVQGGGGDGLVGRTGGEGGSRVRGAELSFHLLKILRSLSMAINWELMELLVASLMAVERKLIAWRSLSSKDTVGGERYL